MDQQRHPIAMKAWCLPDGVHMILLCFCVASGVNVTPHHCRIEDKPASWYQQVGRE